jgi:hypothetical protein
VGRSGELTRDQHPVDDVDHAVGGGDVGLDDARTPDRDLAVADADLQRLAVQRLHRAQLHAISNSYGGDEGSGSPFKSDYNHPGIAVTASSGDNGWDGCSSGPCFPASSQYVEAVGGTSLTSINPRVESAWAGAGSACSNIFQKPPWQTDSGCARRTVADVSADADPNTGVAVYDSQPNIGGWAIFGGTSASSPMLAAFDTLVGSTDPSWAYSDDLWNDVTTGSNGTCGTYICNAGPGYDGPTGLGTPNGTLPVDETELTSGIGGRIALAHQGSMNQLDALFVDPHGAVHVMWAVGGGKWQGPVPLTAHTNALAAADAAAGVYTNRRY